MNATVIDLRASSVRALNRILQGREEKPQSAYEVRNPSGAHAVAVGREHEISVDVRGHVGYYCAGMNQTATIRVHGNAGTGVAENMMSGEVRVTGDASQSAGATGHGGLLVIEGDASARCGISMKGIAIVVGGRVGHLSAFMAQAGSLVVCGDAGSHLGDSLYEANLYVGGSVASLGADCEEKAMEAADRETLDALLDRARMNVSSRAFRKFGSARSLYHFHVDKAGEY